MTVSNPSINFDNTNTTTFRAWGLAVNAALAAVGLVQTTDTGQINWTTVTLPGATQSAAGYEIWRLNDTAQASKPVFVKIEYGTGGLTTRPSMWITYSTGTNGAGTLNGLLVSGRYWAQGLSTASTVPCWFASDGSYLTMVLNSSNAAGSAATFAFGVFFDRVRDATGAITVDGFQWAMTNSSAVGLASVQHASRFGSSSSTSWNDNSNNGTVFTHGIFSFRLNNMGAVGATVGNAIYSGAMMYQIPCTPASSSQYLGDTYYYPQLVTCPVVSYGLVTLCGFSVDMPPNFTTTVVPVLGASHTYLVTPYDFSAFGGGGTYMRTLVRYE